jgi:hypothetical protein
LNATHPIAFLFYIFGTVTKKICNLLCISTGSDRVGFCGSNKYLILQCAVERTIEPLDCTIRPQCGYVSCLQQRATN